MNSADCPHLRVSTHDDIGLIVLDRPDKRNAINVAMIEAIGALFASPPPWKAVVIAADGPHFSAGLDLAEHRGRTAEEVFVLSRLWHRATGCIVESRVPVVAALHGAVIGAGLELAAAAHVRVAEAGARFSLPEGRRGIFVGGGASVRVGRLIGASRMTEMMLTGREVDAEEALRIGLSHRLVPQGAAREAALAVAGEIAGNAPLSNAMILTALAQIDDMPAQGGLFTESLVAALTQSSPEAVARMDAFLGRNKRNA